MITEKDYCDYDTCVALREVGYKGISRYFYATKESPLRRYSYDQILTTRIADAVGHTLAISLYSAQKWLREEKGLFVEVVMSYGKYDFDICSTKLEQNMTHKILCEIWGYKTYEEALSEGIKEAVKLLKEK